MTKFLKIKKAIYFFSCLPLVAFCIWAYFNPLSERANVKPIFVYSGYSALFFFIVVLSLNPLIKIFPTWDAIKSVNRHRRLIGVVSFVYALLHLSTYILRFYLKNGFFPFQVLFVNLGILPGVLAFIILLFLALTSSDTVIKMMGWKKWRKLHRSAYFAEAFIVIHVFLEGDLFQVLSLCLLGLLFLIQLVRLFRSNKGHA
jgi:methionine sulfoxide reductase heme-binding subunit